MHRRKAGEGEAALRGAFALRVLESAVGAAEHCASNADSMALPMAMLVHGSNAAARSRPKALTQAGASCIRPSTGLPPLARISAARAAASARLFGEGGGSTWVKSTDASMTKYGLLCAVDSAMARTSASSETYRLHVRIVVNRSIAASPFLVPR